MPWSRAKTGAALEPGQVGPGPREASAESESAGAGTGGAREPSARADAGAVVEADVKVGAPTEKLLSCRLERSSCITVMISSLLSNSASLSNLLDYLHVSPAL